mgnify:CR=1 FL=1
MTSWHHCWRFKWLDKNWYLWVSFWWRYMNTVRNEEWWKWRHDDKNCVEAKNKIPSISEVISHVNKVISWMERQRKSNCLSPKYETIRGEEMLPKSKIKITYILMDRAINPKTRFEVLQSCVIPTLLYGCQTWTFSRRQTNLIQVCQRKMERRILDIRIADRIRNEELRKRSDMVDAASSAHLLKWRWGGHIARMEQDRWAYAVTIWDPRTGSRNRGRPRHRWSQELKAVVGSNWMKTARDRARWKEIIKASVIKWDKRIRSASSDSVSDSERRKL